MRNAVADLSGYLGVLLVCLLIGAILWLALRKFSTIGAIVWILAITILAPVPIFIMLALRAPADFANRRDVIVISFYNSAAPPIPYDRSHRTFNSDPLNIPNHLRLSDRIAQLELSYMKQVGVGDDGCISISMQPPLLEKVTPTVTVAGTIVPTSETCRSFPKPTIEGRVSVFQLAMNQQAQLRVEIQFARLMQVLKALKEPWQAQITLNSELLTEDARGAEAWRNIRDASFMRPITLSAERTQVSSDSVAIDLAKESVAVDVMVYRPRSLSKHEEFYAVWIIFIVALTFVSGAGWLLIERAWRLMRRSR